MIIATQTLTDNDTVFHICVASLQKGPHVAKIKN